MELLKKEISSLTRELKKVNKLIHAIEYPEDKKEKEKDHDGDKLKKQKKVSFDEEPKKTRLMTLQELQQTNMSLQAEVMVIEV
jgi:deoxycytidylate deaminase